MSQERSAHFSEHLFSTQLATFSQHSSFIISFMLIRALYRAVSVPGAVAPYATILAKVFYPAQLSNEAAERNFGVVGPDKTLAPFPVVLFCNGVNGPPEVYQWLAEDLAAQGYAVVTFAWVTDELPGGVPGLTPGVDVARLAPDQYGTGPTSPALAPLLADLAAMNESGTLAGCLDLGRVALGGHSAGGSVALTNANPSFFPTVRAAFAYGAHTQAATPLGYAPGAVLRLADDVPMLLLGGNRDGVIAASTGRYQQSGEVAAGGADLAKLAADAITPLRRTFDLALKAAHGHHYLGILDGANHFSLAFPADKTTGRAFLDQPTTRPAEEIRAALREAISDFLAAYLKADDAAQERCGQRQANELWPVWEHR